MPNPEETRGIKEFSPLLDLPGFDIIHDLPADGFHLLFEGICKQMMARLLDNKAQDSALLLRKFGSMWRSTKVFSEHSRRTGYVQLSLMKGSEFGLITLVHLPSFAEDTLSDKMGETWYAHIS